MNSIQAQIDYARTQPWFLNWIDALHLCELDASGYSIVDIPYWKNTDEGHNYWQNVNNSLVNHCNICETDELYLADLQPYLPDYPEIFL